LIESDIPPDIARVSQLTLNTTNFYLAAINKTGVFSNSEVLATILVPTDATLRADCDGCVSEVGTNPTAEAALTIKDDGVTIGTITIATDGTVTMTTPSNAAQTIASGSKVTVEAQATADATLADFVFSLYMEVTLA
jgi:hypothetical protein